MTTDRAWKLATNIATAVCSGGPYSEAELKQRIISQVSEALLHEDWRLLPEDEKDTKQPSLLEGQLGLELFEL
jgi:hypothetical protein